MKTYLSNFKKLILIAFLLLFSTVTQAQEWQGSLNINTPAHRFGKTGVGIDPNALVDPMDRAKLLVAPQTGIEAQSTGSLLGHYVRGGFAEWQLNILGKWFAIGESQLPNHDFYGLWSYQDDHFVSVGIDSVSPAVGHASIDWGFAPQTKLNFRFLPNSTDGNDPTNVNAMSMFSDGNILVGDRHAGFGKFTIWKGELAVGDSVNDPVVGNGPSVGKVAIARDNNWYSDVATPGDMVVTGATWNTDLILQAPRYGNIRFATNDPNPNRPKEKMTIDSLGNIGIWETNPQSRLHIGGGLWAGDTMITVASSQGNGLLSMYFKDFGFGIINANRGRIIDWNWSSEDGDFLALDNRRVNANNEDSSRLQLKLSQTNGFVYSFDEDEKMAITTFDNSAHIGFKNFGFGISNQDRGDIIKWYWDVDDGDFLSLANRTTDNGSPIIRSELKITENKGFVFNRAGSLDMVLNEQGKLGIGTDYIPTDYQVAIDGGLICEEVRCQLRADWPDYVFESNYDLMPLAELEQYIQANKHLPEIPAATEIKHDGISLGEMDAMLLKKIEELTLYMLELKKENEELKGQVQQLVNQEMK